MRRYIELLTVQVRASLLLALQYRLDFFMQGALALFWSATALVPLYALFTIRDGVAGWTGNEMLIVVGFFTAHKGVLASVIQPSLTQAVEHIRKGTLDFLLLKPADAQFMISTSKLEPAHAMDVLAGFVIIGWATVRAGFRPSLLDVALALALFLCGLTILYALWILVISLAFRVVKIDNMSYLFVSLFDAARWPSSVFRGALAFLFTYVIPLALMTTYPALAVLGRVRAHDVGVALAVALGLTLTSRFIWTRSIRYYTGASS
ncbi:MAG: ABC-2 family transporter protein [Polyangiales bacterium]